MRLLTIFAISVCALAQPRPTLDPQVAATRTANEKELESLAVVERKVMVPMRDGKKMAADIYRPKDASKKYPTIFVRTPYNFNYWDVRSGVPITLGSDGHVPEDLGRDYDRALSAAHACGYRTVSMFSGRERREMPLG